MDSLKHEEFMRLTGTHASFTRDGVERFLTNITAADDRADWAVHQQSNGTYLGEIVLNSLDKDNRSMNFRIALNSPEVLGQGYGTEATRAVVRYGLDVVGLG